MAPKFKKAITRVFGRTKKRRSNETANPDPPRTEITVLQCSESLQQTKNEKQQTTWYVDFSTDGELQDGTNINNNDTAETPPIPQNECTTACSPPTSALNPTFCSAKKITIQEFYDHFHWLTQRQIQDAVRNNRKLNGIFPETSSECITLEKFARKSGLTQAETHLNKWFVYVQIQCASNDEQSPVAHLLPHLFAHLTSNFVNADDVSPFWKSVEKLVSSLTKAWMTQCENCEEGYFSEDADILRFLGLISEYFAGRRVLSDEAERKAQTLLEFNLKKMQTVISKRAKEIFDAKIGTPTLENLVKGTEMLMTELKSNQDYLKNLFRSYGLAPYLNAYDIVYSTWDHELSECLKSLRQGALSNLQPIQFIEEKPDLSQNFDFKETESLFELYAVLRDFSMLTELPPLPDYGLVKGSLHDGFRSFVTEWIDMVCLKTVGWIERAIQIDSFEPAAPKCKISSSAVDAADVFVAIKALWLELKWPDPEEAFPYAILMQEIFSRCIQHYVERVCRRVQELENIGLENSYLSVQFCLASNNVEHVLREFQSVPTKLCIEEIIDELSISRSPESTALEQCILTPYNLIDNLTEKINRKMSESWVISCAKASPTFELLLRAVAHGQEKDVEKVSDEIVTFHGGILSQLNGTLTETEFKKAVPIVWNSVFKSFEAFVQNSLIGTPKEPKFYNNLSIAFDKLFDEETHAFSEHENLEIEELKENLRLHGSTTPELIFEYCQETAENQRLYAKESSIGKLSLLTDYSDTSEILRIKILNGSPTNWKSGDPKLYVRFQLHTRRGDKVYPKCCSKRKRVPLFDQEFELKLPRTEFESGAYLHLWLKQGRFPFAVFLGETFLSVQDILCTIHGDTNINSVPQTELQLYRTTKSDLIDILERRKSDDLAVAFSKSHKSRVS